MSNSLVSINLVVLNGEKYIRYCLDAILGQTYPHELIELNILDNGSMDGTKEIIKNWKNISLDKLRIPKFFSLSSEKNLGMWPGQEELLKYSNGKYVLAMAVDVILDKDFVKNAVEMMGNDVKIGSLQAKIYKYDLINNQPQFTRIIDTLGFNISRSRRITNIGHGEQDVGQYDDIREVFGVEGACPFFRREALDNCRVNGEIFDHDYFWYGDDLDFAWRMNLFGWKQILASSIIAWHDRQTTKSLKKSWIDYILRVPFRHQILIKKRRLDWRNTRWTIVKNDYIINILKDLPYILIREISVLGYTLLFEPKVFFEISTFFRYLPKMLKKRKGIMAKAVASPMEIRNFFK